MKEWYVVYTKSRFEKKMKDLLDEKGITTFLPLNKVLKQRSDRKKWVEEPLFKSYLFVKISVTEFETIRFTPGFVKFVVFERAPAIIRQQEIDLIGSILKEYTDVVLLYDNFHVNDKVVISGGLLKGSIGNIIKYKGKNRLAIKLQDLHVDAIVEVPAYLINRI